MPNFITYTSERSGVTFRADLALAGLERKCEVGRAFTTPPGPIRWCLAVEINPGVKPGLSDQAPAQPGTSGLPPLAVTTYTYDDYLDPATKTEAFGSAGTRTTTYTYDSAGRPATQAIAVTGSGMGAAIPEVKTVYSANSRAGHLHPNPR